MSDSVIPSASPDREARPPAPPMDARERRLDPRVVRVWQLSTAIGLLIPLGGIGFGVWSFFPTARVPAMIGLGAFWIVWTLWYPGAQYRRWRWSLAERALELRHGVIVHSHDAVPYFRIQQIDISQGPFDRMLGLASLSVTTASASGSAGLPGIPAGDAPQIREELLRRAAESLGDRSGEGQDAV